MVKLLDTYKSISIFCLRKLIKFISVKDETQEIIHISVIHHILKWVMFTKHIEINTFICTIKNEMFVLFSNFFVKPINCFFIMLAEESIKLKEKLKNNLQCLWTLRVFKR